jgi:hypothetical protein
VKFTDLLETHRLLFGGSLRPITDALLKLPARFGFRRSVEAPRDVSQIQEHFAAHEPTA